MSELIDTPEFRVNLMVAALALIMIFHARADRGSHRVLFGFLTALVLVRYVAWRLAETLPPADLGFGTLVSWVFLAFEMIASGQARAKLDAFVAFTQSASRSTRQLS